MNADVPKSAPSISEAEFERLARAARAAAARAYCPYSKFPVGSAVLTVQDEIFSGCNVENASYGLTICAERAAVFQAVAHAAKRPLALRAVLVYTPTPTPTAPCGACRQVVYEFGPEAEILAICDGSAVARATIDQLLPGAFGPGDVAASKADRHGGQP